MSDDLGFENVELAGKLARVYEGNAARHRENRPHSENENKGTVHWTQSDMLAASSYVIAGSYWTLAEPRRAIRNFREAANLYKSLRHSYWMIPAMAAGEFRGFEDVGDEFSDAIIPTPQAVAFGLVGAELPLPSQPWSGVSEQLDRLWRHLGNVPVGRLGVPLDYYGQCAHAMRNARARGESDRLVREAGNYIRRAAEVLRHASHDRFHWVQMQSTLLPAEPEAIAMTTAMSMMSHQLFDVPLEIPDLDEYGRRLIRIGETFRAILVRNNDFLP